MRTVVFVCTGNICRSPIAEAMATQMLARDPSDPGRLLMSEVRFESAGTASWHVGDGMDPRAHAALVDAGYSPHDHAAQLVALDRKHRQILAGRVNPGTPIIMLRPFDRSAGGQVDVADPYYGTADDFTQCAQIIERSVAGLLASLGADEV